ncbi:unnamed protein product [Dracunculus medinensis]|uniref:INTS5_C domain-containing protein n=1 Tax=Dracunculus medinensis TaxID=318479 RepID=A0A158Q3C7_DRAME|nr:unnamed protein product [Dracunculus medinensis]
MKRTIKRILSDFQALTIAAEDVSSVYRNLRPLWASYPVSNLVDPAVRIFVKIPCARNAFLHYVGMLTHEATHLYFSKKENPHFSTEFINVERAVRQLTNEIQQLLDVNGSKNLASDILIWSCLLFIDICKCNYERPIAKKTGISSIALLELFQSCPSVNYVINLTDKAISLLLNASSDECLNILMDASRHGFCFDWIWLHIAVTFPEAMVPCLLELGHNEFKEFALSIPSTQAQQLDKQEIHKQKFISLCEIITYLASKRRGDLRKAVREMLINSIEKMDDLENMKPLSDDSDLTTCFLFKLSTNSPEILQFLVHSINDLVNYHVILYTAMQLAGLNQQCILPVLPNVEFTYVAFFRHMIFYLKADILAIVFQMISLFVFDLHILEDFSRINQTLAEDIRVGATIVTSDIIGIILSKVYDKLTFNVADFVPFNELTCDASKLKHLIQQTLDADGERSTLYLSYLNAFCMASEPATTSEIIARFIVEARNEQELLKLSALLLSILPFSPNVGEEAMKKFFTNRAKIEEEKRNEKMMQNRCNLDNEANILLDEIVNVRWLENLRILNEWQKALDGKNPLKYVRFEMTKFYGEITTNVFSWVLDTLSFLDDIQDKAGDKYDQLMESVVQGSISLCSSITVPSILSSRFSYKICAQFATLLITLLKNVCDDNTPSSYSLFLNMRAWGNDFLCCQVVYLRQQFMSHFLDEALMYADKLFDCSSIDVWEMEQTFAGGCRKKNSWKDDGNDQISLFEQIRTMSLAPLKAVQMAHSGVIGAGLRRKEEIDKKSGFHMRRLIFFDSIQRLACTTTSDNDLVPLHQIYKHLAIKITDRVCKDGLTGAFIWNEWEQEKENIARYIAAARRLSESYFLWDLMFAVAEVYPCLWYCSPLLKSIFATILIQFENNSDRKSLPSKEIVDLLDRWFLLTKRGQMLPRQLALFVDVIQNVSIHEGHNVLLDIWHYFQNFFEKETHPINTLNTIFEKAVNGVNELIQGDLSNSRETCRLVIQRNIVKLGCLFPLIFADELVDVKEI